MNSITEKEKKLSSVLEKLKNLNFKNPQIDNSIAEFNNKKNQLEIEKKELEDKYNLLKEDYEFLSKKIEEIKDKEKLEERKQIEFSEKIDELNQETETLIEGILSNFHSSDNSFCILDLGTGTGCILAALLTEFKDSIGICLDKSLLACQMAQRNLSNLQLANRSSVLVDNWGISLTGAYKIISCNPPYISIPEIFDINQEIREFEPRLAIDGGIDGLKCYRSIAPIISSLLCPDEGIAALEIGHTQANAVSKILFSNNLEVIGLKQDLAGLDRCLLATVRKNDGL